MNDIDVSEIARILFPWADKVIVTGQENARALTPAQIRERLTREISRDNIFDADSVRDALSLAENLRPRDGVVVVTGSLYLIGEAKEILNN
jgi:dihydrofolate synthase/folylpolyglutamate synthase